jgi:hypothetical protein
MKNIFLLLLACLLVNKVKAQRWFPIGTKLTYTQSFWESPVGFKPAEWTVVDTATVKGRLCQKFMMTKGTPYGSDTNNFVMYLYDSSSIVYWFRPELDSFTVLYDFNKAVGESWTVTGIRGVLAWDDTLCTLTVRVKEKGMDTINGIPLRTIGVEVDHFPGYATGFRGKIVEYIGHTISPRPNPFYSCRSISESSDFMNLRCFDHPDIGFHDYKLYPDCDYVVTSIGEFNVLQDLKISPNPSNDFFLIQYHNRNQSEAQILVNNVFGQQITQQRLSEGANHIDAAHWLGGVYFYSLWQEGRLIAKGKLLKQ